MTTVEDSPAGLFQYPRFMDGQGHASLDPLAALPPRPAVDLAGLALMLSSPALELEFMPASPWHGATLCRAEPLWPSAPSDPADLHDQFRASVERCMQDAGTVAVFFSGGLDSLAVLLHARAVARRQGRKVIAVTVDLLDDNHVPVSSVAGPLISLLAPDCQLVLIGADPGGRPEPPWLPHGPRLRGLPRLNRAANEAAELLGAAVMLNGNGGDELFMTRDYLALALAREKRWKDLARYMGDVCRYYGARRGLAREAMAILAPLLGPQRSFELYTAVESPALSAAGPLDVLAPALRAAVSGFTRSWLRSRAAQAGRHPWCRTLARDMLWPFDPTPGYGTVPERSPFMDPGFAGFAAALPLAATYSAARDIPYHRHKALVAGLAPPQAAEHLPRGKQQFTKASRRYFGRVLAGRRLTGAEHGLFSADAAGLLACQPHLAPVCHAMDVWLEGAIEQGAVID